ncbi:MAG: tetratricopeptide repeat protein [Pasteurellaceae bacterium]|nr:tetratricopeptide repeat protein [Pasteurellaceae bacterium]
MLKRLFFSGLLGLSLASLSFTANAEISSQTDIAQLQPLAEQGNVEAQFYLGIKYAKGLGVAQDYSQAEYWYKQAAKQGVAEAQFNLGKIAQDYSQAMYWYEQAAEQGLAQAQSNFGAMYEQGRGVTQDYSQAKY